MTKQCSKCKNTKPLEKFKKGLNQYSHTFVDICKECRTISKKIKKAILWKKYYEKNKSKLYKDNIQWRKDNPEKLSIIKQRERIKNKDKYIERWKKNYYQDLEKSRKRNNQYRIDNPEIIKKIEVKRTRKRSIEAKNLTNKHIKFVITRRNNLKPSDIPDELVELKREQLKLRRIFRNDKKMQQL